MKKIYPPSTAVCETDDEWAGRNLLHDALKGGIERGHSRQYRKNGVELVEVVRADRPSSWSIESPYTKGRRNFSVEISKRDAALVTAFLRANNISVTPEAEPIKDYMDKTPWTDRSMVRVFGDGSYCDPYADDPATIQMCPEMFGPLWNLVRAPYEAPEY